MEHNNLMDDVKEYVKLAVESYKLKFTKGLSTSIGSILSMVLIIAILQLVLIALTVALVLLVGKLVGDYMVGAFIATGAFALLLLILIACRRKLFSGTFAKLLLGDEGIRSIDDIDKRLMTNEVEMTKQEYAVRKDVDYLLDWKRYVTPIVTIVSQFLGNNKNAPSEEPKEHSGE